MFCDKCGKKINHGGSFCEKCKENVATNGFLKIDLDSFKKEETVTPVAPVKSVAATPVKTFVKPKTDVISEILKDKKKIITIAGCAVAVVVVAVLGSIFFISSKDNVSDETNYRTVVKEEQEKYAYKYLMEHLGNNKAEFDDPEMYEDKNGIKYFRYQRMYEDIPVYGDIMVVAVDNDNNLVGEVQGEYREINLDGDFKEIEKNKGKVEENIKEILKREIITEPELVVYCKDGRPDLAWCADVWYKRDDNMLMFDKIFVDVAGSMVIGEVSNIITDTVLYYKEGEPTGKYTYLSDEKGDIAIYDKIPNNNSTKAWFLVDEDEYEKATDDDIKNELLKDIKKIQKDCFAESDDEVAVYVEDCDFENSFCLREPGLICMQFKFELYKNDADYKKRVQELFKKEYISYIIDSVTGLNDSELRKGYKESILYLMGVEPDNYTSKLYVAVKEIIDSENNKEKLYDLLIGSLYMMTAESNESGCREVIEILNKNTDSFDEKVISEAFKTAGIEWVDIKEPEKDEKPEEEEIPDEEIKPEEEEKTQEMPEDIRPKDSPKKGKDDKKSSDENDEKKFDDDNTKKDWKK